MNAVGEWWRRVILRRSPPLDDSPRRVTVMRPSLNDLDPYEPPGGQDDEPPDLRLAVTVVVRLLMDLNDRLEREHREDDAETADLLLRLAAVLSVMRRVRTQLEEG